MEHSPALQDLQLLHELVSIFGLGVLVILLFHRLRLPPILGFLLTGALVGPHGLGLVEQVHEVELLAEIGVVLLLFTIGLELSLGQLLRMKRLVFGAGFLQSFGSMALTFMVARWLGRTPAQSACLGFLVALSSTAVVLKILQERGEIEKSHGQATLSILIFQDLLIVPLMLLLPTIAGEHVLELQSLFLPAVKSLLIVGLVGGASLFIIPRLLFEIARAKNRELFLLCVASICFSVAMATQYAGLSLALGAFLAGLIISESEYSHEAFSRIQPFRDIFTSLFFVSIGMLLDVSFVAKSPGIVVLSALGIIVFKALVATGAIVLVGFPLRIALLSGLALAQIGEFSFVLSKKARELNLLNENGYQIFLAYSLLSIALTPFLIQTSPWLASMALRLPFLRGFTFRSLRFEIEEEPKDTRDLRDHLIIVGFGVNGRNVARAAEVANIPSIILELNPVTVREERSKGRKIMFGDAVNESVLKMAHLHQARVLVIAIAEAIPTRQIVAAARALNPSIYIISRTRLVSEVAPLFTEGANEVIPEEYETSIEIFTRVLAQYLVPKPEIEQFVSEFRSDGYQMFRGIGSDSVSFSNLALHLPDVEVVSLRVHQDSSIIGKNLLELELRSRFGLTLLAIQRGEQVISNPASDISVASNDILLVLGPPRKVNEFSTLTTGAEELQ